MKALLLVFLGGGLGSVCRFLVGKLIHSNYPISTLLVNILGSLLIGFIVAYFYKNQAQHQNLVLFLATGFCGGFTTFSAFALENFNLLKNENYTLFFGYTFGSIVLGILAVMLGIWLAKTLL